MLAWRLNPITWMETCLKIRTKEGELIPFKLNKFQKSLIRSVLGTLSRGSRAFIVILKGRQLGISTVCRGLMLWRALHFPGQQCVFSAHEMGLIKRNMTLIREMIESLSPVLGYPVPNITSETRIGWKHGSTILPQVPGGKSEGRGMPVNFLHCSEADFYDSIQEGTWERFMGGVMPAIPRRGSIVIVESTCQGRKALYDLYSKSLVPHSEWQHLFFPWYEEEQYVSDNRNNLSSNELALQKKYNLTDGQINFWADFSRQCGELMALREYPFCIEDAFTVSGSKSLITPRLVEQSTARSTWPLQEREPVIMGLDPSRMRDATGVAIRQGRNMLEVCEIPPLEDAYRLADAVQAYIVNYKVNVINCDSGGMGSAFIDVLRRVARRFITPVDFSAKPRNTEKYFNMRAEMYDGLRQWLAEGGKLSANTALIRELLAIEINDRREGRLLLEPKHKLSKSPNMADACALTMTAESFISQSFIGRAIDIKPWR
jgi:hypothetical protein